MKDKYETVKNVFKEGDWVVGTNKHVGCSQIFDWNTDNPQPFSYLDETDPDEFRLATPDEIANAKLGIYPEGLPKENSDD